MVELPHPSEGETLVRKQTVRVPDLFVRQFIRFFAEKAGPSGFTLSKARFYGSGGTVNYTLEEVDEIEPELYKGGEYLLQHRNGILTYYISIRTLFEDTGTESFARITQVPNPEVYEYNQWTEEVFPRLPEDWRHRTRPDKEYLPSLLIQSDIGNSYRVELINEDFNLEDFYKFLTPGAFSRPTI